MRIINQGNDKIANGYIGRWTCGNCGCVFELTADDGRPARAQGAPNYTSPDPREQHDNGSYYMPCPTCHREVRKYIQ